ncbi:mechanosensitive ion channel family protein [Lyngbya confervoides]|uniref:Mechanosensitive ion channel family protein n=1 Tax=Lyngbya confervoides BDU141951 TaxID=1574623 RepID=A0ABD4T7J9_9CYAN|nr:mechanosensitive ion channel family protein [Lyngbya confervoides]MCM1984410.1 mechanosensitive ion channel family protein [Lyngbya confervoides BDU141951]
MNMWAPLLAQSSGQAAEKTADQAKQILAELTTWKFFQAVILIVAAFLIIKAVDKCVLWLSEKVARDWRLRVMQFLPFLRTSVLAFTVVSLMNLFLNLSRENILAVTGTVAVALGFAFKDYASSIIAGLVGLFEAPYRVGDRVQIGDYYGEVTSFGLRGIRLRTPSDTYVTIPHNQIWNQAIANANMGQLEAQVVTRFYLDHHVDVQQVKDILYRVAYTSRYTHLKLPIMVVMEEKSWGSYFKLKCYPIDARDEFNFQTDLTLRAKAAFVKAHIPYPRLLDVKFDPQRSPTDSP